MFFNFYTFARFKFDLSFMNIFFLDFLAFLWHFFGSILKQFFRTYVAIMSAFDWMPHFEASRHSLEPVEDDICALEQLFEIQF